MKSAEAQLAEACHVLGWKHSFRTRGKKRYATITWRSTGWANEFGKGTKVVQSFFPKSHMTSGGPDGATYRLNGEYFPV